MLHAHVERLQLIILFLWFIWWLLSAPCVAQVHPSLCVCFVWCVDGARAPSPCPIDRANHLGCTHAPKLGQNPLHHAMRQAGALRKQHIVAMNNAQLGLHALAGFAWKSSDRDHFPPIEKKPADLVSKRPRDVKPLPAKPARKVAPTRRKKSRALQAPCGTKWAGRSCPIE